MRLHCEVEVVSRHLPALGMRNRGKGVRAVLSLCQQAPRTPPGPRAGGERGGRHPAWLFISTLKDKRGTRYEVRGAGGSGVAARRSCPKPDCFPSWTPPWGFPSARSLNPTIIRTLASPYGPEGGKILRITFYFYCLFLRLY